MAQGNVRDYFLHTTVRHGKIFTDQKLGISLYFVIGIRIFLNTGILHDGMLDTLLISSIGKDEKFLLIDHLFVIDSYNDPDSRSEGRGEFRYNRLQAGGLVQDQLVGGDQIQTWIKPTKLQGLPLLPLGVFDSDSNL